MSNLTNTPIHRAISRAFPQTNWPAKAIDLLSKFEDGEMIEAKELSKEEMLVMFDLTTAGIIECNRRPIFHNNQFAGFENRFRYCSDLNYQDAAPRVSKSKDEGLGMPIVVLLICLLVLIFIIIPNWIKC